LKSGNLNRLEPLGPVLACNGITSPFTVISKRLQFKDSAQSGLSQAHWVNHNISHRFLRTKRQVLYSHCSKTFC